MIVGANLIEAFALRISKGTICPLVPSLFQKRLGQYEDSKRTGRNRPYPTSGALEFTVKSFRFRLTCKNQKYQYFVIMYFVLELFLKLHPAFQNSSFEELLHENGIKNCRQFHTYGTE